MSDFHKFQTFYCGGCGNRLTVPVYCGDRFCPVCSGSRRARIRKRLKYMFDNSPVTPGQSLKFLTLTIPNVADLSTGMAHLVASFRKLRQRSTWKHLVSGGVFVVEITGTDGNWHVHIHAVIMGYFFPVHQISRIWQSCSGGKIVNIKAVRTKTPISYITKYLTKPEENVLNSPECRDALRSVRLVQPFGTWHGLHDCTPKPKCQCPMCNGSNWMLIDRAEYRRTESVVIGFERKPPTDDDGG